MPQQAPSFAKRALFGAIALCPWSLSLYLLYWLEYGEIWSVDTAFRSLIAVVIIAVGMVLSFFAHSLLLGSGKSRKQ